MVGKKGRRGKDEIEAEGSSMLQGRGKRGRKGSSDGKLIRPRRFSIFGYYERLYHRDGPYGRSTIGIWPEASAASRVLSLRRIAHRDIGQILHDADSSYR
jgi:hypothetical protein